MKQKHIYRVNYKHDEDSLVINFAHIEAENLKEAKELAKKPGLEIECIEKLV
jgi:hypothetical protein